MGTLFGSTRHITTQNLGRLRLPPRMYAKLSVSMLKERPVNLGNVSLLNISLTADCQSVKRQPHHASHCQWQSVAAAFVLFFANGTNIVANWVKKRRKVKEDSSNIFKIANIGKHWQTLAKGSTTKKQGKVEQILHCLKVAKVGKMW